MPGHLPSVSSCSVRSPLVIRLRRRIICKILSIAKTYGVKHDTGIVVQKGDKLRILVTSIRNPELTVPFNTRQVAQATAPTTVVGGISLNTTNVAPADTSSSYLVDAQGNIQFPIMVMSPSWG